MSRSTPYDLNTGTGPFVRNTGIFRPLDAIADLAWKIRDAVTRRIDSINRDIAYRRTVAALSRLSDHTLRDIGISRSEIMVVAWKVTRK